ncbi:SDR family NAD(P)-dependent oxidoreductase [SAR92 clade bacterium H246]
MNRVLNKVAIVTGGGSGIGKAACQLLAQEGAKVVVTDIDLDAAEKTARKIAEKGGVALPLQLDITSEARWDVVIETAVKNYTRIDILVNNAAVGMEGECKDISLSSWNRMLDISLTGAFLGVRSAMRAMLDRNTSGSIVNVSSGYGLVGGGQVAYSAAKGGVTMLTKSVAIECGKLGYNIRVNSIHPGAIETPMTLSDPKGCVEYLKNIPMGRFGKVNEVASGIMFLASDESSYMTGSSLVVDGGYTAA